MVLEFIGKSLKHKKLENHMIQSTTVRSRLECVTLCTKSPGCLSLNVLQPTASSAVVCELNTLQGFQSPQDISDEHYSDHIEFIEFYQ